MSAVAHIARFGDVSGSHGLIGHSGLDAEFLEAINWYTDLPAGPTAQWQPYHAGFPAASRYVVRYTRADRRSQRAGMVTTTVVAVDLAAVGDLQVADLAELAASDPSMQPHTMPSSSGSKPEDDNALAAVIDTLADHHRALWLGQEGFIAMVGRLWSQLAPSDRARLVFGLAWHPGQLPYPTDLANTPLLLLATPPSLRQRFEGWPTVDPSDVHPRGPVSSALLDAAAHSRVSEVADRLHIEQPTLNQYRLLVDAAFLLEDADELDGQRLRGAWQLLAVLAPDPESGVELKDAISARAEAVTTTSDFSHVRALRTFPRDAYPNAPDLQTCLSDWAEATVADLDRHHDLVAAVNEMEAHDDELTRTLASCLDRSLSSRRLAASNHLLETLASGDRMAFRWIADHHPDQQEVDEAITHWAHGHASPPDWLPGESAERGWSLTHATTCVTTDPIAAWDHHARVPNRSRTSDAILNARMPPPATVRAALHLGDVHLRDLATELVTNDPELLKPAQVDFEPWRSLWAHAVAAGADPWAQASASELVPAIIDHVVNGEPVDDVLLDVASRSIAADLSGYSRRRELWTHLEEPFRTRFLDATARAVARAGSTDSGSLEPELVTAMLKPDNIAAVATVDVVRALDTMELLSDRVNVQTAMAVVESARFDQETSRRFGQLVRRRRLKRVARELARRTETRGDLRAAAEQSAELLGLVERAILVLASGTAEQADELNAGIVELASRLYPDGPTDDDIWERAGGDPSELREGKSGKRRWRRAVEAILDEARGAPTLRALVDEMSKDFDRDDLKRLRSAM